MPCRDCVRLAKECFYPPAQRRMRRPHGDHLRVAREPTPTIEEGLNARTTDNRNTGNRRSAPIFPGGPYIRPASPDGQLRARENQTTPSNRLCSESNRPARPSASRVALEAHDAPPHQRHGPLQHSRESISGFDFCLSGSPPCQENNEPPHGGTSWEYHEPWSWTSICSETGSKWVCNITQSQHFVSVAKQFSRDLVPRPSYQRYLSTKTVLPELDEATASGYVEGK